MGMSDYYQKLRDKVGNDLLFIPSVAGVVRNELGEILLQNKGNGEKWSLPAGAIEPGEAPAGAMVREVWEETGLSACATKVIGGIWRGGISLSIPKWASSRIFSFFV